MQKIESVKSDSNQWEKQKIAGIEKELSGGGVDAPGLLVIWPGDSRKPPAIQFIFRKGEAPKRYNLELFILKLEELGILEGLPLDEDECNCDCTDKSKCSEGGCKCHGGDAHGFD